MTCRHPDCKIRHDHWRWPGTVGSCSPVVDLTDEREETE